MAVMGNRHAWAVAFGVLDTYIVDVPTLLKVHRVGTSTIIVLFINSFVLGNIISVLVFLAPVPSFYRIYKKKSTESLESLPYQVALLSCMLWLYYALIKKTAFLLITINSFGCVVETLYISMFLAYAPKNSRMSAMKLFAAMNIGAFSLILVAIHFLVKSSTRIKVAISVCVFAAPLSIMARVIRTRSVEFMPFNLSFFLTLSAIMWFSYGVFIKDFCVAVPNVVGFILGMLQMLLYAIYRNSDKVVEEEEKDPEETHNSIAAALSKPGSSGFEVHPIDIDTDNNNNNNTKDKNQTAEPQIHVHHKSFQLHPDESPV